MKCEEFLHLMDEDRLEAEPSAAEHLESCASCRAAHSHWRVVHDEFKAMRDEPAPPFLHTRVMAHVRSAEAERRSGWSWLFLLRPSWATTLLVLMIGIFLGGYGVWQWKTPRFSHDGQIQRGVDSRKVSGTLKDKKETAPTAPEPKVEESRGLPAFSELPSQQAPKRDLRDRRQEEEAAPALESAAPGAPASNKAAASAAPSPSERYPGPADERSFATPQTPAAGAEVSREEQLPESPSPADREYDYATSARTPSEVVCTLKPVGQGALRAVQLPTEAAPPAGGEWRISLSEDGTLRVFDAQGRRITGSLEVLAASLSGLHLQPGQYLLRRIS